jgi:hypothetical protein
VKLLTANELRTGVVLWWGPDGWSPLLADASGLESDVAEALKAREEAGERVVDVAVIDTMGIPGAWRPVTVRERIRGFGPTVRPDLAVPASEWR